ncbi:MAG: polysaccharide deacetylase [Lachnospiraceae bacterium]|nr:polysaccharide deacetylase [Lachnospiraceae bacterium]
MEKIILKKRMAAFITEILFLSFAVLIGILIGRQKEAIEVSSSSFGLLNAPVREVMTPLEGEKIAYLTFDDGPSSNTEKILDILEKHHAKATFFVVGEGLTEKNRPVLERMKAEGHSIGLHAYSHVYEQLYASPESLLADYEQLFITLKEDYGIETALFRFPGGSASSYLKANRKVYLEELEKRGFSCFDWQVSGEDAVAEPTVYSIQQNIFQHVFAYDTPIILLHDGRGREVTVEALPGILERLKEEGYRFDTLEHAPEYTYRIRD